MSAADLPVRSLRRDLALGLALGLTVLWLATMAGVGFVLQHEIDEVFDAALQEAAERILPLAVTELINTEAPPEPRRVSPVGSANEYMSYVVRDATGKVMLYSRGADLGDFNEVLPDGFHYTAEDRVFSASAVSGAYRIEVAEPLRHRRDAMKRVALIMLAPLALLLPMGMAGVAVFTRRSLAPVAALSREVRARDATGLSPLKTEGLQSELLPIRDAIDRLMARLARTLEAERSFTANAAHELRTPVAATLAQTQRLIAEAPEGPLRDRARSIEAELRRLTRLSEKLLQLSRAEGGGVLGDTAQDLAPILALVADDFRRAGQADRLQLSLPAEGAAMARIDPDAFAVLARNLIENALTHGDPAQPVTVTLAPDASLTVRNAGSVVPPEALARLTTRFERAGARSAGSGLGLAIVDGIARGAGATLTLSAPAPGQIDGFEARVTPAPQV
ncbi:ATP-binding protein [Rhodobacter ferrooxidans]|uniref:histidine kinase n=1 Tax=Rhodobacter ferrooxidans TaxID=371731 RepID=C8RZP6_9RHOB|nr:ATP-binding protein [Rhodobacter sp. SW2]EEW25843.1 histidine kinase [Rhodobacter sp. SW2]